MEKRKKKEDVVEDIYGVHFKYQDLFTRLLKVQKQRRHSEAKSGVQKIQSFDGNLKRTNSTRNKNLNVKTEKRNTSGANPKNKTQVRSNSMRKTVSRHLQSEKKSSIFKSFSPSHISKNLKTKIKKKGASSKEKGSTGKLKLLEQKTLKAKAL